MPKRVHVGSAGLWTAPNLDTAPMGALKRAQGCVIRRNNIIEQRRPMQQIGISADFGSSGIRGVCDYNGRLYVSTSSNVYVSNDLDASGAWTAIASPQLNLEFAFDMNRVLYEGTYKIDSDAGTPYFIGVPRAPDVQLTLVAGTLLATGNGVGYRVVYGILDAKNNLVLGPPSGRATTTATGAQNVSVKSWIPTNIVNAANGTSYFVQVYRTSVQTVSGVDPGEEMQLVYQAQLTSADIANKFVTVTDAAPDAVRGAAGYFCPSQDGLGQANYQPPRAGCIASFKGQAFYGNTTGKHRLRVQLLGVKANLLTISTGAGGITKSGAFGIYTFTGAPDLSNIPTDGTAKLSSTGNTSAANNGEFTIAGVDNVGKTITVNNAAAVTEAGTANSRGWPSKITLNGTTYFGSINGTESVGSRTFKVSTSGTDQQNVSDTSQSLLRVANQQAGQTIVGYYESGPDDGAGRIMFEEIGIGGAQFFISVVGTLLYNSFNPTLPSSYGSQNDAAANRLYVSKVNQPEHVPVGSYFDIGSGTKTIRALVPLRDALLVWKDDGLFKVLSDGAGNLSIGAFDTTLRLASFVAQTGVRAPVTTMQNRAYAITNKGVVSVTDASVSILSAPVALIRWLTDDAGGGSLLYSVVGSERDGVVYFGISSGAKVSGLYSFIYCPSGAWTEFDIGALVSTGAASPVTAFGAMRAFEASNGRIHRWTTSGHNLFREASASLSDQSTWGTDTAGAALPSDRFLVNVTGVNVGASTAAVTVYTDGYGSTNAGLPAADLTGCALVGSDHAIWLVTADSNPTGTGKTLTLALLFDITGGGADISAITGRTEMFVPIKCVIEWLPHTGSDDSTMRRNFEVDIMLAPTSTIKSATVSAYTEDVVSQTIAAFTSSNTPVPSGASGLTILPCLLPANMRYSRRLSVILQHSTVCEYLFVVGVAYDAQAPQQEA